MVKSTVFRLLSVDVVSPARSVFRLPPTPHLCLKARKTEHSSIIRFTVSTVPHVHTGRCCLGCSKYDDVRFLCPVRRLVKQPCSRRLHSPACYHLPIFSFTIHSLENKMCHVCCLDVSTADAVATFRSAGLIFKSTSGLSTAVRHAESVSSLTLMARWLGTHIKVNCIP